MCTTPLPPNQPWLTGEIFDGHFEVGELIARGGMAEVYHGVDLWSNNPVAIKVLFPQLSADPSQQQKFFREERSLRQINHDHVVGVVGSGTQKVGPYQLMYIVLDYVHGCTLQQLFSEMPVMSVGQALQVLLPVTEGLAEVHAHQLIHRDIKPSNVLLSVTERSVKLTDFGLTRRTDQNWTGELMGTPSYVAPEIVTPGSTVGPGVDIFALGVMAFRMIAGRLPFRGAGDDQQVIYHNVNTEFPSVTQFAPDAGADIAGFIKWCTRKHAKDRPADGAEAFLVLKDIAASLPEEESAPFASESDELWAAVAAVAERTGCDTAVQRRSISGFGDAPEILADPEDGGIDHDPATVGEAADVSAADVYYPTAISGVGPQPKPSDDEGESPAPQTRSITAHYRPADEVDAGDEPSTDLGYRGDSDQYDSDLEDVPAHHPSIRWQEPPTLVSVLLTVLLLLLGFVAAGFVGWQLANSVINSGWFASWQQFFGP